jgi:predicted enzyme related to lactoylglutathione lyase
MARVLGIGGIFFKSEDPEALYGWYKQHLGIPARPGVGAIFPWRQPDDTATEHQTVWAIFPARSNYFDPSKAGFMVNYIVDDLNTLLENLRASGLTVDNRVEEHEYGKFAWVIDPDGNRLELWEPKG